MTFQIPCPTCRRWLDITNFDDPVLPTHRAVSGEEECPASGKHVQDAPAPKPPTKKEARE